MIKLQEITQFGKNVSRFRDVVAILVKYGFAGWIPDTYPDFIKDRMKSSEGEDLSHLPLNVRLRKAMAELGTTFIKLGLEVKDERGAKSIVDDEDIEDSRSRYMEPG